MKANKNDQWVFHHQVDGETVAEGVTRRILAYGEEIMCVENSFQKGARGALHSHPHSQITYVVEGAFEFTIDGVTQVVRKGDSMLKQNGVVHGCVCVEKGILLDLFTPMRKDFIGEE